MIKMRTGRRKRRGGAGDDVKAVKSSEVVEGAQRCRGGG